MPHSRETTIGLSCGVATYLIFGLSPAFWKLLVAVPAAELLAYRILFALIFAVLLIFLHDRGKSLKALLGNPKQRKLTLAAALMIGGNWFVFVYAIISDQILQVSLGYFITPLVNISLGRIFLKEELDGVQKASVLLAACGVLYLTIAQGSLPWISLAVGCSFGFYGLFRKLSGVPGRAGLTAELFILGPLALAYLGYLVLVKDQPLAMQHGSWQINLLLIFTGILTIGPLLTFAAAVRRVALTTIGFLQYIGPTCNFFLGWLVYHEPLTRERLIAFVCIWIALAIYTAQGIRTMLRSAPPVQLAEA